MIKEYMVFPPEVLYCNIFQMIQLQQQTKGKTMNNFQLSLFYDLQAWVQASSFYRKYYLIFKAMPKPCFPDRFYC